MLSIIIADDEAGIIELCRALIDIPDAKVIGEAHNGLELYDKISALQPNTVITDIRMPGMTGLELIEKARAKYPFVNFIVMSGYTDFEYVQMALRNGVWDYLLKPLKKSELNSILRKLDAHLEVEKAQQRQQVEVAARLDESIALLRERYVREVWISRAAVPLWGTPNERIFDLRAKCAQWLTLCMDGRFQPQHQNAHFAEEIRETILSAAAQYGVQAAFTTSEGGLVGLMLYPTERAEVLLETFRSIGEKQMWAFNARSLYLHCTCIMGTLQEATAEGIAQSAAQVRAAQDWRLEREEASVICYNAEQQRLAGQYQPFARLNELREAVLSANLSQCIALLRQAWEEGCFDIPGSRARRMRELIDCINYALQNLPDAAELIGQAGLEEGACISEGFAPGKIEACMQRSVRQILDGYQSALNQRENSVVTRARQFVQRHQSEDISLNDVASYVGLSPAYFSTIFKQETGGGFIKYLQHVRMERAKQLLRESSRNIRDIAEEVGYRDIKHFNKIFYNETNVTPSEYRKFYQR